MDRTLENTLVGYVRRGWSVIPIPYRSKNPGRSGWDQLRLTEADLRSYFHSGQMNIGVLLGEPSGWLVDVDLDHELAIEFAPGFLPPTSAVFGRSGKPQSHRLYQVDKPTVTRHWRLPNRKMVVELRSTGSQTVFPGSEHPSGELIEWHEAGEPAVVDPCMLSESLQRMYQEICRRLDVLQPQATDSNGRLVPKAPNWAVQRARRYLAKLPPAVSGQGGHCATFRACCVLVVGFGLDRDQAFALLAEWNESCQPPWSEKELEHKLADAMQQPGWRGHLLAEIEAIPKPRPIGAIERANRHAIEHRRRAMRRARS